MSNETGLGQYVLLQETKVYQQGEKVAVRGVLQHLDISRGEGRHNNTKLRIIYPSWLSFDREQSVNSPRQRSRDRGGGPLFRGAFLGPF